MFRRTLSTLTRAVIAVDSRPDLCMGAGAVVSWTSAYALLLRDGYTDPWTLTWCPLAVGLVGAAAGYGYFITAPVGALYGFNALLQPRRERVKNERNMAARTGDR